MFCSTLNMFGRETKDLTNDEDALLVCYFQSSTPRPITHRAWWKWRPWPEPSSSLWSPRLRLATVSGASLRSVLWPLSCLSFSWSSQWSWRYLSPVPSSQRYQSHMLYNCIHDIHVNECTSPVIGPPVFQRRRSLVFSFFAFLVAFSWYF